METLAALLDLRDRRLRHQGDSGGRAVGEQHVDDLLRGAVAEELAERLLVPGDAGRVDPRDEILLGVALQRRDTEARVLRQKVRRRAVQVRSEEQTSELQSLMRISYAVFCLKKKNKSTSATKYTE